MDFQDLKVFKQLYLQRNITAVSRSLYLSQPTVSYRLKKIQEDLGVDLYKFDGTYHFNEKSKMFFDFCVQTLDAFEKAKATLRVDEQYAVSLSTIATSLYQNAIFQACLSLNLFPSIRTCTSGDAIVDVLEGRARFAIVGGFNKEIAGALLTVDLKNEKIVFVYNKECSDSPDQTPIVLDQQNSGIRKGLDEYLSGFTKLKIVGEVGTTSHRLGLVNERQVGMFIQERYLQDTSQYQNICVSKKHYFNHSISLISSKSEIESPLTSKIIEIINKQL